MAKHFRIEHVAKTPSGWRVRTVTQGDHEVRIAFPPGAKQKGSGHVVEILHPQHENPAYCPAAARVRNPAELVLMGANPARNSFASEISKSKRALGQGAANPRPKRYPEYVAAGPSRKEKQEYEESKKKRRREIALVERRHNPHGQHFGIRWNAGNVTGSYSSFAEAEKVLDAFHGKGHVIKLNPMELRGRRHRNPVEIEAERAQDIREGFVDEETRGYVVMDEPHIPKGDYALLSADLVALAVKPTAGGETEQVQEIDLKGRAIHVISDTSRRRMYFAGGNQRLTTEEISIFTDDKGAIVELGECRQIVYMAKKYHPEVENWARGKNVPYGHNFGERSGVMPTLAYDTLEHRLILKGGDYTVEDAGIVN